MISSSSLPRLSLRLDRIVPTARLPTISRLLQLHPGPPNAPPPRKMHAKSARIANPNPTPVERVKIPRRMTDGTRELEIRRRRRVRTRRRYDDDDDDDFRDQRGARARDADQASRGATARTTTDRERDRNAMARRRWRYERGVSDDEGTT